MMFKRTAQDHMRSVLYSKMYKQHKSFLEEKAGNEVVITLKAGGVFEIENKINQKTIKKTVVSFYNWIYGE